MSNAAITSITNGGETCRPARLPRWTREEIVVLIQGKRVIERRGRERGSTTAEPKWAAVSSYCRRHGVNRGAVQCRKRWSNLAGDFKKIKEWEIGGIESFWGMRNDARRERKLPGFFDREVFDLMDGVSIAMEEVVFDSGRSAGEDGIFSDFDEESEMEKMGSPVEVIPISEKKLELVQEEESTPDATGPPKDKHQTAAENSCKDSPEQENSKRQRQDSDEDDEDISGFQSRIIKMLDQNNRMLAAQLESQNMNTQLDREQRKDQVSGLLGVLNKLADALGRIADKL